MVERQACARQQRLQAALQPPVGVDRAQLAVNHRIGRLALRCHQQHAFIAEVFVQRGAEVGLRIGPVDSHRAVEVRIGITPEGVVDHRAAHPLALPLDGLAGEEAALRKGIFIDARGDPADRDAGAEQRAKQHANGAGQYAASKNGAGVEAVFFDIGQGC
ncbi:hypothetical protein D3C77_467480 [compost metagenome]